LRRQPLALQQIRQGHSDGHQQAPRPNPTQHTINTPQGCCYSKIRSFFYAWLALACNLGGAMGVFSVLAPST